MRDIAKISLILAVVCMVSGLALGFVYDVTRERIEETGERELLRSLGVVLPGAARFSGEKRRRLPDGREIVYYEGYRADGRLDGYALVGEKRGYQSLIRVLVGISPEGVIKGIDIVQQAETPGLGALVDEVRAGETLWSRLARLAGGKGGREVPRRPWFQEQYSGLTAKELKVLKPPYNGRGIHAITGATITSRAVTAAVRESIEAFLDYHLN